MKYLLLLLLVSCSKSKDGYCKYDTAKKYEHYEWSMGEYYPSINLDSVYYEKQIVNSNK
jgi:hypothetical protein